MPKNRNHLIDLLIGNLANAVVHNMLEKAANHEEIANRYRKEMKTSMDKASEYRKKIHPENNKLLAADEDYIRQKAFDRVVSELRRRISRGYMNIDIGLAEQVIDDSLKKLRII